MKIDHLKEILNELNKLTQKAEEVKQAPACQTTLTPKLPNLPVKPSFKTITIISHLVLSNFLATKFKFKLEN